MSLKCHVLLSVLAVPSLCFAELQPANYSYSFIAGSVSQLSLEPEDINDITGYRYAIGYNHEFTAGTYFVISANHTRIDDTASFTDSELNARAEFEFTGNSVALAIGKAVGVGDRADLFGEIGLGYSSSDIESSASVDGVEVASYGERDSNTGVFGKLGARFGLDNQKRFELIPLFYAASVDGEIAKRAGLTLAAGANEDIQVTIGASKDLDEDQSSIELGLKLFF